MEKIAKGLADFASKSGTALDDCVRSTLSSPEYAELRRYVMAVLDPSRTYGHSGRLPAGEGDNEWDENAFWLLDRLARRELTGNALKAAMVDYCKQYTPTAVDLMSRALAKDLRCGVGIKTINNLALPDFRIPVFTCQLAKDASPSRFKKGSWVASIKFDGMRALGVVRDNTCSFFSRSGKPITALDHLAPQVLDVFGGQDVVIDCEGVSRDFLDTVSELRTQNPDALSESVELQTFDLLPGTAFRSAINREPVGGPLEERLAQLALYAEMIALKPALRLVEHVPVADWEAALAYSDEKMAMGLEGAILKRLGERYIKDRTDSWLKIKQEDAVTVEILSVYEGEPDGRFIGQLGGVNVAVNGVPSKVGGGWTPYERAAIWAAHTNTAVAMQVVEKDAVTGVRVMTNRWVQPDESNLVIGRLIDVKCNGFMPSGAMRHARKIRFRDLKSSPGHVA